MAFRKASQEPRRRIAYAFERWDRGQSVNWKRGQPTEFVKRLDATRWTQKSLAKLAHDHIAAGNCVCTGKHRDGEFDDDRFYFIILPIPEGADWPKPIFFKFILKPDELEDPGVLVVSVHWQEEAIYGKCE